MPIEIRELVIKATINDASSSNLNGTTLVMSISPADRETLIEEITNRVIKKLTAEKQTEARGALPSSFEIPPVKSRF